MPARIRCTLWFSIMLICYRSFSQTGSIQKITCQADTTHRYALYLPSSYTDTSFYPLIIFFDPGARGDLPLLRYKELADEMGLIMAGSFNSRNFEPGVSEKAFVAIYNDIVNKYSVRAGAVWLSGFSGGARIASSLSMVYNEINAVIACGAGFADDAAIIPSSVKPYAAIVGKKDMNYSELLDNNHFLDKNSVNNILLVFEGDHTWPGIDHMGLAIEWLLEQKVTTARGGRYLKTIDSVSAGGSLYPCWQELVQLNKIPAYKRIAMEKAELIAASKEFAGDQKKFEEAIEAETNYINRFSLLLQKTFSKENKTDKAAWQQMAADLSAFKNSNEKYMQESGVRCADHSYRSSLETYYQFMNTGEFEISLRIAEALTWFGTSTINSYYLAAKSSSMMGNKKMAEKNLKEAIKKGGLTETTLLNDRHLQKTFSQQEIHDILSGK